MSERCQHCGQSVTEPQANRLSISGMFDCHLFCSYPGNTVDEVITAWKDQNSKPYPAMVEDRQIDDLGFADLCPVIVLHDDKELRRVGQMVMQDWKTKTYLPEELEAYRQALLDDPDIPRLLSERIPS